MRDLSALHRFLAERGPMPFEWGHDKNDCVSFAVSAVEAMTGSNPLTGFEWSNEDEAATALNAAGGIEVAVGERLAEVPPPFAKRGDVGAIESGNGLILVIVEGDTLVGPGPRKLRRLPRKALVKAWSAE